MALDPNKEKMLDEWLAVRNAILRAEYGEFKVTYIKPPPQGEGGEGALPDDEITGVFIELMLQFPGALKQNFTKEEKKAVEDALSSDNLKKP